MISLKSSVLTFLARLTLLCICLQSQHAAAMKGKVPVYMPFPVPVPMPLPAGGGGGGNSHSSNKFHHHHHLHHQDQEGEVKKIYLLQPVEAPKQQRQPTAVFNPMPIVEQQPIQQQQIDFPSQSYSSGGKALSQSNDMKILPIVVIPPIAPMPPIQVHSQSNTHHQTNTPRMTLSPQFNNYLVSPSRDEPVEKRTRHINDIYQDHKSFSDYGGSGGATTYRRERGKFRPRGGGGGSGSGRSQISYDYMASKQRSRLLDDYGDDYDYTPSVWRPRSRSYSSNNRRAARSRDGDYKVGLGANNIRDVIDYQTIFDDEPFMDSGNLESRGDPGTSNSRASRLIINGRSVNLDTIEEHSDKDYLDNHYSSASSRARAMMLNDKERQSRLANEIISYDRDYHDEPQSRLSIKYTSSNLAAAGSNPSPVGKKVYIDDKELMHGDDEWRFESVNSINHVSLNATQTSNSKINSTLSNGIG